MKIGVNSNSAPIPGDFFSGAGGGLLGGLFSLIGSGFDARVKRQQQERQMQHDKNMAALNQENTLAQMEQANAYQVEQWNRENEYNDPSAVAERYRAAGINPRAALGGAATGAGIAGSLSSAPSGGNTGSASNVMYGTSFGSLGSDVLSGARLQAQNKRDDAEAQKAYEEAKSRQLQNEEAEFMKENGVWQSRVTDEKSKSLISSYNASMKKIDAEYYDFEHQTDVRNKYLAGQNLIATNKKLLADVERLSKLNELTEEDIKLVRSRVSQVEAETNKVEALNTFFDKFGFYPAEGSDWQSALIGLGAKGIGELADYFKNKPKKVLKNNDASLIEEYKNAKTPEQKKKVVAKMHHIPALSRGFQ